MQKVTGVHCYGPGLRPPKMLLTSEGLRLDQLDFFLLKRLFSNPFPASCAFFLVLSRPPAPAPAVSLLPVSCFFNSSPASFTSCCFITRAVSRSCCLALSTLACTSPAACCLRLPAVLFKAPFTSARIAGFVSVP